MLLFWNLSQLGHHILLIVHLHLLYYIKSNFYLLFHIYLPLTILFGNEKRKLLSYHILCRMRCESDFNYRAITINFLFKYLPFSTFNKILVGFPFITFFFWMCFFKFFIYKFLQYFFYF